MSSPRVEIDLNGTDDQGRSLVFLNDANGELQVGRMAIAYESEDGVCAPALVQSINQERGTAFLWVDWQSLTKESSVEASIRMTKPSWEHTTSANATVQEVVQVDRTKVASKNVANEETSHRRPIRVVHLPSSV